LFTFGNEATLLLWKLCFKPSQKPTV